MGPKKDKKKKKPLSKRLAATNLSKKEIESFINRHLAINHQQYGAGGGPRVSRLSKADAKQYADMRNYYSPMSKAPKTLNIPVGTSPKDFFLSEKENRAKTQFEKLKELEGFRQKLIAVELEKMRLGIEPTLQKMRGMANKSQFEVNIQEIKLKSHVEAIKHNKVLGDLAIKAKTDKNKYETEYLKNKDATKEHERRYGKPTVVEENGIKRVEFKDANSFYEKQKQEQLAKIAIEAEKQDQQFNLDQLKHINKHNRHSKQIGGTIK